MADGLFPGTNNVTPSPGLNMLAPEPKRLSRSNRFFLRATGIALIPPVIWILASFLLFTFEPDLGPGGFVLIGLAQLLMLSGIALGIIPWAWLNTWLFERFWLPRRRLWAAALWAMISASLGGLAVFELVNGQALAWIQLVTGDWDMYALIWLISLLAGLVVAPLVGLVALRRGIWSWLAVILGASVFGGLAVFTLQTQHERHRHPAFTIYLPGIGSTAKVTSVQPSPFTSLGGEGPSSVRLQLGDKDNWLMETKADPAGIQQTKTGRCLPAGYQPTSYYANDYACHLVLTSPGGIKIYQKGFNYFFGKGPTFFTYHSVSAGDLEVGRLADDLVPAAGLHGDVITVPDQGNFLATLKPSAAAPTHPLEIYIPTATPVTQRYVAPNGSLTLSVIYPAGSKTSIYIAETLALSSRPKCAVYQGDSQCRSTFTTNMGDTVYKDKYGTYTLVRHETQVELGYQARSANEQGASEAQMKVLINSLTLE